MISAEMSAANEVSIREFMPGDAASFRRLNEEWIERHFAIEPKDEEVLSDPEGKILGRGGKIFLAVIGGQALGCCALVPLEDGEFEIAKMAVTESVRRAGIGRKLLLVAIAAARSMGGTHVWLETNHTMTPAIRLYESVGFRHIAPERFKPSLYARSDVQMEFKLSNR
ncbi:MAG TPA: GNAT family N-acetyltransferase [Bryobacteraceae bacterium]|nr:GNAT family N-acetyltransferase [Bryobacteraceae bacterium]